MTAGQRDNYLRICHYEQFNITPLFDPLLLKTFMSPVPPLYFLLTSCL